MKTVEAIARELNISLREAAILRNKVQVATRPRVRLSYPVDPKAAYCRDEDCEIDCAHPPHIVRVNLDALPPPKSAGATLRSVIVDHLSTRDVKPFSQIYTDVLHDYGTVADRTVWRALCRLIEAGIVAKICLATNEHTGAFVRVDEQLPLRLPALTAQVEELFLGS